MRSDSDRDNRTEGRDRAPRSGRHCLGPRGGPISGVPLTRPCSVVLKRICVPSSTAHLHHLLSGALPAARAEPRHKPSRSGDSRKGQQQRQQVEKSRKTKLQPNAELDISTHKMHSALLVDSDDDFEIDMSWSAHNSQASRQAERAPRSSPRSGPKRKRLKLKPPNRRLIVTPPKEDGPASDRMDRRRQKERHKMARALSEESSDSSDFEMSLISPKPCRLRKRRARPCGKHVSDQSACKSEDAPAAEARPTVIVLDTDSSDNDGGKAEDGEAGTVLRKATDKSFAPDQSARESTFPVNLSPAAEPGCSDPGRRSHLKIPEAKVMLIRRIWQNSKFLSSLTSPQKNESAMPQFPKAGAVEGKPVFEKNDKDVSELLRSSGEETLDPASDDKESSSDSHIPLTELPVRSGEYYKEDECSGSRTLSEAGSDDLADPGFGQLPKEAVPDVDDVILPPESQPLFSDSEGDFFDDSSVQDWIQSKDDKMSDDDTSDVGLCTNSGRATKTEREQGLSSSGEIETEGEVEASPSVKPSDNKARAAKSESHPDALPGTTGSLVRGKGLLEGASDSVFDVCDFHPHGLEEHQTEESIDQKTTRVGSALPCGTGRPRGRQEEEQELWFPGKSLEAAMKAEPGSPGQAFSCNIVNMPHSPVSSGDPALESLLPEKFALSSIPGHQNPVKTAGSLDVKQKLDPMALGESQGFSLEDDDDLVVIDDDDDAELFGNLTQSEFLIKSDSESDVEFVMAVGVGEDAKDWLEVKMEVKTEVAEPQPGDETVGRHDSLWESDDDSDSIFGTMSLPDMETFEMAQSNAVVTGSTAQTTATQTTEAQTTVVPTTAAQATTAEAHDSSRKLECFDLSRPAASGSDSPADFPEQCHSPEGADLEQMAAVAAEWSPEPNNCNYMDMSQIQIGSCHGPLYIPRTMVSGKQASADISYPAGLNEKRSSLESNAETLVVSEIEDDARSDATGIASVGSGCPSWDSLATAAVSEPDEAGGVSGAVMDCCPDSGNDPKSKEMLKVQRKPDHRSRVDREVLSQPMTEVTEEPAAKLTADPSCPARMPEEKSRHEAFNRCQRKERSRLQEDELSVESGSGGGFLTLPRPKGDQCSTQRSPAVSRPGKLIKSTITDPTVSLNGKPEHKYLKLGRGDKVASVSDGPSADLKTKCKAGAGAARRATSGVSCSFKGKAPHQRLGITLGSIGHHKSVKALGKPRRRQKTRVSSESPQLTQGIARARNQMKARNTKGRTSLVGKGDALTYISKAKHLASEDSALDLKLRSLGYDGSKKDPGLKGTALRSQKQALAGFNIPRRGSVPAAAMSRPEESLVGVSTKAVNEKRGGSSKEERGMKRSMSVKGGSSAMAACPSAPRLDLPLKRKLVEVKGKQSCADTLDRWKGAESRMGMHASNRSSGPSSTAGNGSRDGGLKSFSDDCAGALCDVVLKSNKGSSLMEAPPGAAEQKELQARHHYEEEKGSLPMAPRASANIARPLEEKCCSEGSKNDELSRRGRQNALQRCDTEQLEPDVAGTTSAAPAFGEIRQQDGQLGGTKDKVASRMHQRPPAEGQKLIIAMPRTLMISKPQLSEQPTMIRDPRRRGSQLPQESPVRSIAPSLPPRSATHPQGQGLQLLPAPGPRSQSMPNVLTLEGFRDKDTKVPDVKPKAPMSVDDNFLAVIFKWRPVWLREQDQQTQPPPVTQTNEPMVPLLDTYDSVDDYRTIMLRLLLLETWASVYRDWKEAERGEKLIQHSQLVPVHVDLSSKRTTLDLHLQGVVSAKEIQQNCVRESDLVIVTLMSRQPADFRDVFGFVRKVTRTPLNRLKNRNRPGLMHEKIRQKIEEGRSNDRTLLGVVICMNKVSISDNAVELKVVSSLASTSRQVSALSVFHQNLLARDLLRPVQVHVFTSAQVVDDKIFKRLLQNFNASQAYAICAASQCAMEPSAKPQICLLQGPPGTGKSLTILEIITKIICDGRQTQKKPHVLLCAPSNGSVDELVRRLKYRQKHAKGAPISFVRVGKMSSLHPDVRSHSLDTLTQMHIREEKEKYFAESLTSARTALSSLNKKIDILKADQESKMRSGHKEAAEKLQAEIANLEKRKNVLTQQSGMELSIKEHAAKQEVLRSADVVCSTVNSCGMKLLLETLGKKPEKPPHFTCIVIDEASQCTEVDCLIPLQYGCCKLVLVGDPHQLPATILSQQASEMYFGQSLFERLFSYFKLAQQNPVMLLDTQYRMHPDICAFPNEYVYEGRLKTERSTAERRSRFPLQHYMVFDVAYGSEQQLRGSSFSNKAEAAFIVMLCQFMVKQASKLPPSGIGIVTPYQKQKEVLKSKLAHCGLKCVEVNTVDGFQGREKDVIIMSCVRAQGDSGNIGFLADLRRLNVSLTRARYAMYVVGHLKSLKVNEHWRALIANAQKRHVVKTVKNCGDAEKTISMCLVPGMSRSKS